MRARSPAAKRTQDRPHPQSRSKRLRPRSLSDLVLELDCLVNFVVVVVDVRVMGFDSRTSNASERPPGILVAVSLHEPSLDAEKREESRSVSADRLLVIR